MGRANRSVVSGNWRSGERLSIKRHEGVWRDAATVLYLFFKLFVDVDHFLKPLLNFLQYGFCFMFWFFGHKTCGILASQPGNNPASTALEGEVLTPGWPGKSLLLL